MQRQIAENSLMNAINENFPLFIMRMTEILADTQQNQSSRLMAGTLIKRSISSIVGFLGYVHVEFQRPKRKADAVDENRQRVL